MNEVLTARSIFNLRCRIKMNSIRQDTDGYEGTMTATQAKEARRIVQSVMHKGAVMKEEIGAGLREHFSQEL